MINNRHIAYAPKPQVLYISITNRNLKRKRKGVGVGRVGEEIAWRHAVNFFFFFYYKRQHHIFSQEKKIIKSYKHKKEIHKSLNPVPRSWCSFTSKGKIKKIPVNSSSNKYDREVSRVLPNIKSFTKLLYLKRVLKNQCLPELTIVYSKSFIQLLVDSMIQKHFIVHSKQEQALGLIP